MHTHEIPLGPLNLVASQTKLAKLNNFTKRGIKGDRTLSKVDIAVAIMCTQPPDPATAQEFCDFIGYFAWNPGPAACGCTIILEAGGVPAIADALRRWPTLRRMVYESCAALMQLSNNGSESVRCACYSSFLLLLIIIFSLFSQLWLFNCYFFITSRPYSFKLGGVAATYR
jgi:hypothetical protein